MTDRLLYKGTRKLPEIFSDIRSTVVYLHTDKKYIDYLRTQLEL